MPFVLRDIMLALDESEDVLLGRVAKRLRVSTDAIRSWSIVRRAIDARRSDIHFSYQVEVMLDETEDAQRDRLKRLGRDKVSWLSPIKHSEPVSGTTSLKERPIVVGFGPGGMFAALRLAELGYRPIVLERGRDVRRRHRDILQRFYRDREFDPASNLLFGEGGAGTYSDGKLYTRRNDPLCRDVLETFYQHGASPDILVDTRPHIGSDRLPTICSSIRQRIESLGGEVRFESQLGDVKIDDGHLASVQVVPSTGNGVGEWIKVGPVILAIGHSARDTIITLAGRGVKIEAKPFQIGVRIEHPQSLVDGWQFGAAAGHARLGSAEYHLVAKGVCGSSGDMFSFCMCPGGVILPTNESPGLIATNGASKSQRASAFANSGLVISLDPAEKGLGPLEALEYQKQWEAMAFRATGETYEVPTQRATDFLANRLSQGELSVSYPLGGQWADIRALVPQEVGSALERALPMLDKKMPGFAGPEAIITAPETRASSPVRMVRDKETRQSVSAEGLYPIGEGAGYAGGIVSAAVDGIRSADAIISKYATPKDNT